MSKAKLILVTVLLAVGLLTSACAGSGYRDDRGTWHDHDATAQVWTTCTCATCDRKNACCGPTHCICHPD